MVEKEIQNKQLETAVTIWIISKGLIAKSRFRHLGLLKTFLLAQY